MTAPSALESMEVEVPPTLAVQLAVNCATDPGAIATAMRTSLATLGRFMERNTLVPAGPPRSIYTNRGATTSFTLAFPIQLAPAVSESVQDVVIGTLPGGRTLRFVHRGPYDRIRATYRQIDAWLRERGTIDTDADRARCDMWEAYFNEQGKVPDTELTTCIYLPLDHRSQ